MYSSRGSNVLLNVVVVVYPQITPITQISEHLALALGLRSLAFDERSMLKGQFNKDLKTEDQTESESV